MVHVKLDRNTNTWSILSKENESEADLIIDGYLKDKLDNIKYLQANNWDCLFTITGIEGSGKSTLSFICGQYLTDMTLTLDNIASGTQDAFNKLQKLPDKSTLIIDEAELMFASRDAMKKEQRNLIQILMIIRQKRMALILVCPDFFDLAKYIAVNRSRFLIRTYTDKKLHRGYFAYWGQKKKKKLYELGKKNYGSYSKPKADFVSKFSDYKLPFDKEYQDVKMKSLMEAFGRNDKPEKAKKFIQNCPQCKYEWESRRETTSKCPKCAFLFGKMKISLEN